MKKLGLILSIITFISVSVFAGKKPTDDMNSTIGEYENTQAQWYTKEGLGLLYSEIVYAGWKVKVDKKGVKTVKVKWKNSFTGKLLKKDIGNSTQYLQDGLALLIGDKKAPITEVEAKQFFENMRLTLMLEDLRLRYDNDNKEFKEEFKLLNEYGIIKFATTDEMLQKYASLSEWRDDLVDEVSELE